MGWEWRTGWKEVQEWAEGGVSGRVGGCRSGLGLGELGGREVWGMDGVQGLAMRGVGGAYLAPHSLLLPAAPLGPNLANGSSKETLP